MRGKHVQIHVSGRRGSDGKGSLRKAQNPGRGFVFENSGSCAYQTKEKIYGIIVYFTNHQASISRHAIVWYILGIIEALLAFRFVLKLLAANPNAGFSNFIYDISYLFAAPFLSVFSRLRVEGSVLELGTLLAMLVYYLIALAIIKLFFVSKTISTPEAAVKLENQEKI